MLFLLQLFATLAMFGLIWFVQIVHYPLFLAVPAPAFPAYEAAHANRTGYVVGPLMLLELATAAALLLPRLRPAPIPAREAWLGALLLAVIWLSTGLVQVPLHNRLHTAYSAPLIRQLIATNWIRAAAWSARAILLLRWTYLLIAA